MRFSERYTIVPLVVSSDKTTNGCDTESIHMGKVHEACFMLNFGAITSDDTLKVYVGAATATKTTAVAFKYRHAAADTASAVSDTYGAFTSVASTGLTLTAATFDNKMLLLEVDSQAIADDTPWVTLEIAGSATAQNVAIAAIVRPRAASNAGHSVISSS
jgi:hypothetical protein